MSMIGCYISLPAAEVQKVDDDEEFLANVLGEQDDRPNLCIEKSWQGIHYALNGDPWKGSGPLFNAVLGGKEVGEDLGYGPARILSPEEVAETAKALDAISMEDFENRVSKCDFTSDQIYVYAGEDPDEIVEELGTYFADLQTFFNEAAQRCDAMLIFLS